MQMKAEQKMRRGEVSQRLKTDAWVTAELAKLAKHMNNCGNVGMAEANMNKKALKLVFTFICKLTFIMWISQKMLKLKQKCSEENNKEKHHFIFVNLNIYLVETLAIHHIDQLIIWDQL